MNQPLEPIQFSPKTCREDTAATHKIPRPLYVMLGALSVFMLVYIEVGIATQFAPATVLIQVVTPEGYADEHAECFGDVISGSVGTKKKPLQRLQSVYDYINPAAFFANTDRGFYLLETGLTGNEEIFEIRIVCYAEALDGVSYTIVNNENQSECSIQNNGKVVVC